MKKFLIVFVCFVLSLCVFSGCAPKNPLLEHVSELRSDVFFGQSENYTIKAGYGFKETPYANDGKVKNKVYGLTIKLIGKEMVGAEYNVKLKIGEKEHSQTFKLNPATHSLTAFIVIDEFTLKEFELSICCGADCEIVKMQSQLPENTISYLSALDYLYQNQTDLINSYYDQNGNFTAEIYVRVLVKDNSPYYYVGLASGGSNLKALLIDGINGEILAIREIL